MREVPEKITKIEGGTAIINGKEVPIVRHCIYDSGPQGTAHIIVMRETGTEEERVKNREAIDNVLRQIAANVMRRRALAENKQHPA